MLQECIALFAIVRTVIAQFHFYTFPFAGKVEEELLLISGNPKCLVLVLSSIFGFGLFWYVKWLSRRRLSCACVVTKREQNFPDVVDAVKRGGRLLNQQRQQASHRYIIR